MEPKVVPFSGTKIGVTIGNPYVRWSRKTGPLLEPVLFRNVSAGIFLCHRGCIILAVVQLDCGGTCVYECIHACRVSEWHDSNSVDCIGNQNESLRTFLCSSFFRLCPDVEVRFILFVSYRARAVFFAAMLTVAYLK